MKKTMMICMKLGMKTITMKEKISGDFHDPGVRHGGLHRLWAEINLGTQNCSAGGKLSMEVPLIEPASTKPLEPLLLAVSKRMSRQKEIVSSICVKGELWVQSSAEAFSSTARMCIAGVGKCIAEQT